LGEKKEVCLSKKRQLLPKGEEGELGQHFPEGGKRGRGKSIYGKKKKHHICSFRQGKKEESEP